MFQAEFSRLLVEDLLENVQRPGQYLGNEWGARHKDFSKADVRMALAFPDTYELGMSNFGLKILYQIVNNAAGLMADRTYAPASDMEQLLRERDLPLWAWESREPLASFELVGFSLQYELTYTNVLNMLELADIAIESKDRTSLFPLVFGGGPSTVNPEPMADFMDFFIVGDGERAVLHVMEVVREFKQNLDDGSQVQQRRKLLYRLGTEVPGVYVPSLYRLRDDDVVASPLTAGELQSYLGEAGDTSAIPERIMRQVVPLNQDNQPTASLVPYLSLVHDREVLEVRRGCDRGCRFCQPGYTFLPVRERSKDELMDLSKKALKSSGHEEYSLLSLCVSDYTSLHETVRALNREHSAQRASLSFPSQRADRMNLDVAEELKVVRKSGITLAPEAGTERMRQVVNKGLNHDQIISAIESAYQSGWNSVKLYFMCCLPTERDEDLHGIIDILKEATIKCRAIRKQAPADHGRAMEFTCTISNFVPKPFTPFQWFGQVTAEETRRKHQVLRDYLDASGLKNVTLNVTDPEISLLEAVVSRGDRRLSRLIFSAWRKGATFDAWGDQFKFDIWEQCARELGTSLEELACSDREVGSRQPWEVVHIGLQNWWLVKEWEKALSADETANCTDNLCHACGVCTELDTNHELAEPSTEVMKKNPFVKELSANTGDADSHPSLFFTAPPQQPENEVVQRLRFTFTKCGDLRFISHLDLSTLLIRALRRAGVTPAYTQGYNPQPKLALAGPLPLFMESQGEVAELDLAAALEPSEFSRIVNSELPPEVRIKEVVELSGSKSPSLAASLGSAVYRIECHGIESENGSAASLLADAVRRINHSESIMVQVKERKKRKARGRRRRGSRRGDEPTEKDIRAGIKRLELVQSSSSLTNTLEMELSASSTLHVKPVEVLDVLSGKICEGSTNSASSQPKFKFRVTRVGLLDRLGAPLLQHDLNSEHASRGEFRGEAKPRQCDRTQERVF